MTDQNDTDEKLTIAIDLIKKYLRKDCTISKPISLLQRHLLIGFNEAKLLVDEVKRLGIFHD